MNVLFFGNGNTAVFVDGAQVPELQESWVLLFAKFLESREIDPTKVRFVFQNGREAKVFRIEDGGLNWSFER